MIDSAIARRVRLLGLDVDGVLTDNAVFLGEVAGEPVEFKRFDIQDGLALGILRKAGIEVALHTLGQPRPFDSPEHPVREHAEQARAARKRNDAVPVRLVVAGGGGRIGERREQRPHRLGRSLHRWRADGVGHAVFLSRPLAGFARQVPIHRLAASRRAGCPAP